MENNNY